MKKPRKIRRFDGFPGKKELISLLEIHGLSPNESKLVTLIQEHESEKVGYSFRGSLMEPMIGFEQTLIEQGFKIKFSNVNDVRGYIFLEKPE